MGRALAPLRDEGVFIVGSGMSFHNLRDFGGAPREARAAGRRRSTLAAGTVGAEPTARDAALARWAQAPGARARHPREEHLLPLMVVAGAAGRGSRARRVSRHVRRLPRQRRALRRLTAAGRGYT